MIADPSAFEGEFIYWDVLAAARIVHGVAVKFAPVFRGRFAASRETSVISVAIVEVMINVPVKVTPGPDS